MHHKLWLEDGSLLRDADVLAEIASLLQLRNLHSLDEQPLASDERIFELTDWRGHIIARLAWAPQRDTAHLAQQHLLGGLEVGSLGFGDHRQCALDRARTLVSDRD